jgi:hypothetical protein
MEGVRARGMPARAMSVCWYFLADGEHSETFRAATCLQNDCHFVMIGIDTFINAISGEIKLKRRWTKPLRGG